ncbi:MAG: hypothetical protein K2W88_21080, partial [Pararheinheimera sp.]|nr:hypothetical protein [Rheinheimera sp.]
MYQSIESALAAAQPDDLLRAFLPAFNDQMQQLDDVTEQNITLQQQLTDRDQQYEMLSTVATQQLERLAITESKNANLLQSLEEKNARIALLESTISRQNTQLRKLDITLANADQLKATIDTQRNQLKELNALNPHKLKEQIKRVKDKNDELTAKNTRLSKDLTEVQRLHNQTKTMLTEAHDKVIQLRKELSLNTGSGLFHNGEHHLIVWPEESILKAADGSLFNCRSLLYLHQSGRGGLITYQQDVGARLCSAPKAGLKPDAKTLEFAQNWLYRVNEL